MCSAYQVVYHFNKIVKNTSHEAATLDDIQHVEAKKLMDKVMANGRTFIPEVETIDILKTYGLPVPQGDLATTEDDAVKIADEIGYPVVMKVVSDEVLHKSDAKGVELNLKTAQEVRDAYRRIHDNVTAIIPDATITGIYVIRMITGSEEVILGIKRDPSFGPVLMFGLGGIFVEIFRDISFGVAPLSHEEAHKMIEKTRAYKILKGARGRAPRDIDKIVDALIRLGQLAIDYPQIQELDINPLFVLDEGQGSVIGDARMLLSD
jgi:acyl-CoA synthetase (NDP forming)